MRLGREAKPESLVLALFLYALAAGGIGCGGGSSGGGGSATLNLRALWEQPARLARAALARGEQATGNGFGTDIPNAVQTVQINVESGAMRCCIAVDRDAAESTPIADPESGRRTLVLDGIPEGAASVIVRGFPSDLAPRLDGFDARCETKPAGIGRVCDDGGFATPSFSSDATGFEVLRATRTTVRDILIRALPFIVPDSVDPAPGESAFSPVSVNFIVAIAVGAIDPQTIDVALDPEGDLADGAQVSNDACDDASANDCSPGGALDVNGFVHSSADRVLPEGPVLARIRARSATDPDRALDVSYEFAALGGTPTATPTDTRTRPPTSTPTPTDTPTDTPTATPPSSNTPTPTDTSTPTDTPTPTNTPTPSDTPTPTLTPTVTPTPTPVQRVFVSNADDNSISVIDTQSGLVVDTITGGLEGNPLGVALSPDRRTLYVTNARDDSVSILPAGPLGFPPTPVVVRLENCPVQGCRPLGIDVGPTGGLTQGPTFFADIPLFAIQNTDQIGFIDPASGLQTIDIDPDTCPPGGCQPSRVLFGAFLDRAFVTLSGADRVLFFATGGSGGFFGLVSDLPLECPPAGCGPDGMTLTPGDGMLLVANAASGTLSIISIPGAAPFVSDTVPVTQATGRTSAVAVTPDGTLALVTHRNSGSVALVDLSEGLAVSSVAIPNCTGPCPDPDDPQTQIPSCLPGDVVVSADGSRAFIARTCDGQLSVFDLAERQFLPALIAVGAAPQGLEAAVLPNERGVRIDVGSAAIAPGDSATIQVTLAVASTTVVAVQNDLVFPDGVSITACREGAAGVTLGTNFFPEDCTPGTDCTALRAVVSDIDAITPIPAGSVLYECDVAVSATAAPSNTELACTNAFFSPPPPAPVPAPAADCVGGQIEVTSP